MKNFEKEGADKLSSKYVFLSAIISKLISSGLTYPHEVIRARQQDTRASEHRSHKLLFIIKSAIKREGYTALYSGFMTNLMRILPHYAMIFVLYEHFSYSFSKVLD